jgi:hypothetical protein
VLDLGRSWGQKFGGEIGLVIVSFLEHKVNKILDRVI